MHAMTPDQMSAIKSLTRSDRCQTPGPPPVLRAASTASHLLCRPEAGDLPDPLASGSLSPAYLKRKLIAQRRQLHKFKSFSQQPPPPGLTGAVVDWTAPRQLLVCRKSIAEDICVLPSHGCHKFTLGRRKLLRFTSEQSLALFAKAVRLVCTLVRIHKLLRSDSNMERRLKEMTAEELHYYSLQEKQFMSKVMTLHFHKKDFSASNQVFMPRWARLLMIQQPQNRSASEVKKLAVLFGTLKSFKQRLSDDAQLEFCTHCTYARYERQRVIVRRGHSGQFFYIIFSGSVFVNIEDKDKDGRAFTRTDCVLGAGTLFGEISLFYDMPRSATIVCRESTECVMVDGEVLRRICPDKMKRESITKFNTMRNCDTFEIWPSEVIQQICKHSKVEEYGYNKVIEMDTAASEFIYFVTSGRVEVMVGITPRYSRNGTCEVMGSEKLSDYLPGMRHPEVRAMIKTKGEIKRSEGRKTLISVHTLHPLDCCDLRSLLGDGQCRGLILVSFGSVVTRVPKQQLISFAPLTCWRDLQAKARAAKSYPSDAALNRVYLEHDQWRVFKTLTVRDALERQSGLPSSSKPATCKGTSGAAIFPGIVREMPPEVREHQCLFCEDTVLAGPQQIKDCSNHLPRLN